MREKYTIINVGPRSLEKFVSRIQTYASTNGIDLEGFEYGTSGEVCWIILPEGKTLNDTRQIRLIAYFEALESIRLEMEEIV